MKRIHVLFFMMLVVPSLAFGAKVDGSQMMKGAKVSAKESELPTVFVGGNTIVGNVAQPGWPIIISAAMSSDEDVAPEVPANLSVKLLDQNGQGVSVNFQPVIRKDNSQRYWIADTQNLTPGHYTITFEAKDGLSIEPGELEVESNPETVSSLGLLKMQQLLLTGKDQEAMAQADQLIAKDPQDASAWIAKGDMLMAQDLPDQASDAYEKAFELPGGQTIYLQERMSRAFSRSLHKRGVLKDTNNAQP